jgi:hypothetical protein
MATSPTQFIRNATVPSTAAALGGYETPAASVDKLYELILCNTHTDAVTVSLWLVPSGGSRSAANKIIHNLTLAIGETKFLSFEQRLAVGTTIHGEASVTAVVSAHAAGDRVT